MPAKILIIDDELALGKSLQSVLEGEGYCATAATTAEEGLRMVREQNPDILICDIQLPNRSGLEVLKETREICPQAQVIMITAYATLENAIAALKNGASDYILKPFLFDDLLHRVAHFLTHRKLERETRYLRRSLAKEEGRWEIIGASPAIGQLRNLIQRVAATTSTALICGESGTGKELVARTIHRLSANANGPFLAINCGALPETLMESELFGYRKGAFSGADTHKEGLIQLAEGGTLFLDEIGDLSIALQPKLLRFIERREFIPLGGTKTVRVSTRLLSASNRDLAQMVRQDRFREDLFYRLNTVDLRVPPLRERIEDIPLLVNHMLPRLSRELGCACDGVDPEAMVELCMQPWRGNVRELENVIQRAIILADDGVLKAGDLFPGCTFAENGKRTLREAVREFEGRLVAATVEKFAGDKRQAATQLGVSLTSLYAKLQPHAGGRSAATRDDSPPPPTQSFRNSENPKTDLSQF